MVSRKGSGGGLPGHGIRWQYNRFAEVCTTSPQVALGKTSRCCRVCDEDGSAGG